MEKAKEAENNVHDFKSGIKARDALDDYDRQCNEPKPKGKSKGGAKGKKGGKAGGKMAHAYVEV